MPDAWVHQPALRSHPCNTLNNDKEEVRRHLRSLVSAGHTTAMAISQFSNRGVLDRIYGGFIRRLGTLLTQGVHGKSQTRKHPCGRGANKYVFPAAEFTWLTGSGFSWSACLIAPVAQPPPSCFMSLSTFRAPFLLSRLRYQRVYDSRGNLAWLKTPSQINSTALPPNLTSLPALV